MLLSPRATGYRAHEKAPPAPAASQPRWNNHRDQHCGDDLPGLAHAPTMAAEPLSNEFIVIQECMAFRNSQHLSSSGGAAEQNSIGVPGCQRFCAGMNERLEFSSKASFSGPLVGAIVPFNAVHSSSTEDTQLGKAASKSSLTTSQLRDHVFN